METENIVTLDFDMLMLLLKEVFITAYRHDLDYSIDQATKAWEQYDFKDINIKAGESNRSLVNK